MTHDAPSPAPTPATTTPAPLAALPAHVAADLADLGRLAERAARTAGDLIRAGRPAEVDVAATKTSVVDVVTEMDLASEALIRRVLLEARPDDGVLGEEEGLRPGTSGVTWVIDPIDGTVNYLYGIPAYAVSVAAVVGEPDPATWTVVAGAVHAVADGTTWTAVLGSGAWADGRRLAVNAPRPLAESLVGTGFGYRADRRRAQARVLQLLLPQVRDIRRMGAASLDLCNVASGRLDAYFERGLKPWDLAAGQLVAQEAGAVVRGLGAASAGEAMVVAGSPSAVEALEPLLRELRADTDD